MSGNNLPRLFLNIGKIRKQHEGFQNVEGYTACGCCEVTSRIVLDADRETLQTKSRSFASIADTKTIGTLTLLSTSQNDV